MPRKRPMKFKRSRRAFSLVEAIVGITIIAAIAIVSYLGAGTCFRADLHNSDKTLAVHLIQKSQEEIRRAAQTYYDKLNTCDFVSDNACGLSETMPDGFDRFSRAVSIQDEGSTELKRIEIQVGWTDIMGNAHMMPSVMLMSRPPEPLPGNILGVVTNDDDGDILGGVLVQVTNGTVTHAITSENKLTDGVNYDFSQGGTSNLEAGRWDLIATCPGFYPTTVDDIEVMSNDEERVDFTMTPKPEDGKIIARLRDTSTGNYISFSHNSSRINLYEDGRRLHYVRYRPSQLTYTVEFDDTDPRYFTVDTLYAYYSKYVGHFSCDGDFRYYYHGWSSSVVRGDAASGNLLECSYPWHGHATSDRIEVKYGETTYVDVWLRPVPRCTVTGYVIDQDENPVISATVRGYSYNGILYDQTETNDDGWYTLSLPAEQEIDPLDNRLSHYPRIRADGLRPVLRCCDRDSWETVSGWTRADDAGQPLLEGGTYQAPDIQLNLSGNEQECGNAGGRVLNLQTGAGLNRARAYLNSNSRVTNGAGNYVFDCGEPAPPHCLPQGWYTYRGRYNNYYPFDSSGSAWYTDRSAVHIQPDMTNPVPDIEMLPLCRSAITVEVKDASTGNPIPEADLTLSAHNESGSTVSLADETDDAGRVTFNNVIETWPTPFTSGHPNFKQTERKHSLSITASDFYDPVSIGGIELNCGSPRTIQATMTPKDQM